MSVNHHLSRPVHTSGPRPEDVGMAVILIHGRTQNPADMFAIAKRMQIPDVPLIAIEANGHSWYPARFMEAVSANQPFLDHALDVVDQQVSSLQQRGIPRQRIILLGFSQGACLACEYLYRNPGRWGGLLAFTGGLIGPEGMTWDTGASLEGTPVLVANSDTDTWIPLPRSEATVQVFSRMEAEVLTRVYRGMEHVVCDDEIMLGRTLIQRLLNSALPA